MDWQLFSSIYFLIFLAELPDKTAFATILLSTRSRAMAVFLGVAAAFFIQTVVAALFGGVISLLPEKWVHLGAGILFLFFAVQIWRSRNEGEEAGEASDSSPDSNGFWKSSWKAFLVIFIAEWGDLTQIATASLIAKYSEHKILVFTAAVSALWTVTGIAVFLGRKAKHMVNPPLLKRICSILFLGIGIYFVATSFLT